MDMPLKIACAVIAVICAIISFCAKKILERILKRDADEKEVVLLKAIMLLICFGIAATMILPDLI